MTNLEKYRQAFVEAFEANEGEVEKFAFGETEGWDSIGHMSLIVALEEAFGIEFEPEEIMTIRSFENGKEVLGQKGIIF